MAALTRRLTDAENLQEGRSTRLGSFLVTDIGMNGVGSAIHRNFTLLRADVLFARLAEPVVHDIVFYLRVHRPTINTDIAVLGGTGLGVLVICSVLHALDALTRAVIAVAETHASQVVLVVGPVGLEGTVIVVGHGVGTTGRPLFKAPLGATDRTRQVAVHRVTGTLRNSHSVFTSVDSKGRRCQTQS